VRLFANENDFLLRPEDLDWLRAHLGERAHIFPAGGHLREPAPEGDPGADRRHRRGGRRGGPQPVQ
jgi:hypothetical protein